MVMERSEHRDGLSAEPDRTDMRETAAEAQVRTRRPLKARPPVERVDIADVHRELAARYPRIRARLAE